MKNTILKITAALTAAAMSTAALPVLAADDGYADREYVVSEFVQSVGRNNLNGSDYVLSTFDDADDIDEEYRSDFARAVTQGLVKGYEDKTLRPKENVKRIEALAILARCLDGKLDDEGEAKVFTDVPEWAKDDIDKLSAAGIVLGYGDGTLGANDSITVKQVKLLTDRSDEVFNTTDVGDSFYGYINNKKFRNIQLSQTSYIDSKHGAIVSSQASWSTLSDVNDRVVADENEIIKKLMNGELTYEDGSAEQRVHDMLLCLKDTSEPTDNDKATLSALRERILSAKTMDELIKTSSEIYSETGINPIVSIDTEFDPETNYTCPSLSFATNPTAGYMSFYPAAKKAGKPYYKNAIKEYLESCGISFSDTDYEKAIELQCDISDGKNYMSEILLTYALRTMLDSDFTMDEFDAQLEKLLDEHPEVDSQTYELKENNDLICDPDKTDEAYGVSISDILSDCGYTDCYKIIFTQPSSEKSVKAMFDNDNLNAVKINALLTLNESFQYTLSDEETAALSDLQMLEFLIPMYIDGDDLSKGTTEILDLLDTDETEQTEQADDTEAADADGTDDTEYDLSTISSLLPNDVALIYCKYYYDDETSLAIQEIMYEIWQAYVDRFEKNEWMSDATKEKAISKIQNMIAVIGYPDNYSFPVIVSPEDGGTYMSNLININLDTRNTYIKACSDREFTRTIMSISPDTVNACYLLQLNSMNITAAIASAPIYDKNASKAANLGAIGAIIGHEVGHAFDTSGSEYDEAGRKVNWWTDEDKAYYEKLTQNFVEYYKRFEVVDDVVQDSSITISENMADFAGLQCVMDIIGDDPDAQREALESYATVWARLGTEKYLTDSQLLQDVHSSNNVRVDAVVASLDCFYELYDIDEDDAMYVAPEDRLKLW